MRRFHGDKEIYHPQQMYDIGNGDMSSCCFDFSTIPSPYYQGFFNGLPQLLYKKVRESKFCLDNYFDNANRGRTDAELESSIYKKNSNYSHYLAKILWKVLPRAKILVSLTVDSIPLRNEEFSKIVDSIQKNKSLRSVTFRNTLIRDEGFEYFLEKVSPYRFESIEFTNCQLTSHIYSKVCEFLNTQPQTAPGQGSAEWKLRVFKLDENEISSENIDVIDAMMQKKLHPNDTDDQPTITTEEGNLYMKNRSIPQDNEYEYEYEYYEDDDDGTRRRRRRRVININIHHKNRPNQTSIDYIDQIKKQAATVKPSSPSKNLRDENEKLKRELNELILRVHAIKYSDDVFLIGEDAEQTLADIRLAEQSIQEYERVHGVIEI